jgi:hypothetical protein
MWRCLRVAVARVFALVVRCRIMMLFVYCRVGKNRDTRRGSPAGAGAGRTADHLAIIFSQKFLAVRSGNCIYRLVRCWLFHSLICWPCRGGSPGIYFLCFATWVYDQPLIVVIITLGRLSDYKIACYTLLYKLAPNVRRYVALAQSRGGACFCTRDAMQDYDVVLFILALAKTVTPAGGPRREPGRAVPPTT